MSDKRRIMRILYLDHMRVVVGVILVYNTVASKLNRTGG